MAQSMNGSVFSDEQNHLIEYVKNKDWRSLFDFLHSIPPESEITSIYDNNGYTLL